MIQPRICVAPADVGGHSSPMPRVGFVEPNHWGGAIDPAGFTLIHGGEAASDYVVLTGYNRFLMNVHWAGGGHCGVALRLFSRLTGNQIGSDIDVANMTTPGDNWVSFGNTTISSSLVNANCLVVDLVKVVIKETAPSGAALITILNNGVSLYCGVE